MDSCETSGIEVSDHFREITKMVSLGSGASRSVKDYMLTRYACYLTAQNGDPKKEELPPSEDIKKLERRVKSQEKKLAAQAGKLPEVMSNGDEHRTPGSE